MIKYHPTMTAEDSMGLSNYALERPRVVEKARALQADWPIYDTVKARLIAKGDLAYVDAEESENEFLKYCAFVRRH